jgi:hypothetical protein
MQRGAPVIVQADLPQEGWNGRADILFRIEAPTRMIPCCAMKPNSAVLLRNAGRRRPWHPR